LKFSNNNISNLKEFPTYETLIVKKLQTHVLELTLNRPSKLNSINGKMRDELTHFLQILNNNNSFKKRENENENGNNNNNNNNNVSAENIRVVVVRGAGKGFSAGLDMSDMQDPPNSVQDFLSMQSNFANIMMQIRRSPQIFIAAIDGVAVGGGMALALACDIRIGTKATKMNAAMLNLGLGGADLALSYFFAKIDWTKCCDANFDNRRIYSWRKSLCIRFICSSR